MIIDGKFNAAVFLTFLNKVLRSFAHQKVFMIADGHPAHKQTAVKQWLANHRQRTELFLLPPYSPDLNPDEYFNQDVKTNIVGRTRPRYKHELKAAVQAFCRRKKAPPQQVQKYFHAPSVRYAL
jgi:transposase